MNLLLRISALVLPCVLCITHALAQDKSLPKDATVLIFGEREALPEGVVAKGRIKVLDGGFKTNCGYDETMKEAMAKARKAGANVVHITNLKKPDGFSTCYRLRADVYYLEDIGTYAEARAARADSIQNSLVPDTATYAVLYVYRPAVYQGSLISYQLNADDMPIGRVPNGAAYRVKLIKEGPTEIWAKTEARIGKTIDIQHGKAYFLRCTVQMGVFVGEPQLSVVDLMKGYEEYNRTREHLEKTGKAIHDNFVYPGDKR